MDRGAVGHGDAAEEDLDIFYLRPLPRGPRVASHLEHGGGGANPG